MGRLAVEFSIERLSHNYPTTTDSTPPHIAKKKNSTSDDYEAERRRMAAKMQSEAGKEEYKKRKATVKWPFGNIKHNMKVMWAKICRMGSSLSEIVGLVSGPAAKVAAI